MDREARILSCLDRNALGLEIGPSHRPIAAKAKGFKVESIDHLSQDGLREKYKDHGVDLNAIEPVDYVWNGETYAELTGKRHAYRWIIASHVIEHSPDLIAFIQSCEEVLDDEGVLVLAVPDKRYCFDHTRPPSSLAAVIDANEEKRVIHSAGTAADYYLNVVRKGEHIAWDPSHTGDLSYVHNLNDARSAMEAIRRDRTFFDFHAWCFTPGRFRLIMHDLHSLGYTALRESAFFDTVGHEFIVALSRKGTGPELSRLQLATQDLQ